MERTSAKAELPHAVALAHAALLLDVAQDVPAQTIIGLREFS